MQFFNPKKIAKNSEKERLNEIGQRKIALKGVHIDRFKKTANIYR